MVEICTEDTKFISLLVGSPMNSNIVVDIGLLYQPRI